jgi:hypothetical protein
MKLIVLHFSIAAALALLFGAPSSVSAFFKGAGLALDYCFAVPPGPGASITELTWRPEHFTAAQRTYLVLLELWKDAEVEASALRGRPEEETAVRFAADLRQQVDTTKQLLAFMESKIGLQP